MNAEEVTGSCTYITFEGKHILLECGLYQSSSNNYLDSYKINSKKFKFDPKELDYIFIGHAHLDHCGLLPRLYKEGCCAKIILTKASAVIAEAILKNCSYILGEEARILSKTYKRDYSPIYSDEDIYPVLSHFYICNDFNCTYALDDVVSFQWLRNSHCVGAAQLLLTLAGERKTKKILYTSDIGSLRKKNHFVGETEICEKYVDVAIMESTYGSTKRISRKKRDYDVEHLRSAVDTVLERNGTVIFPAFSFARTQELLVNIYETYKDVKDFKYPVIIDSKLSCQITELYSSLLSGEDLQLWEDVLAWENLRLVTDKDESRVIVKDHSPKIILSSSGFCTNGRVISYLQEYLKDTNSMIIFSGYVGNNESYLSYRIKNFRSNKTININKKPIQNRADCITLSTFSSHPNHDELVEYGGNLKTNLLVLVHGDKEAQEELRSDLKAEISRNNKSYKVKISNRDMVVPL